MKTKYLLFIFILSIFSLSYVFADERENTNILYDYYSRFSTYVSDVENNSTNISELFNYYNNNGYDETYPYYILYYSEFDDDYYLMTFTNTFSIDFNVAWWLNSSNYEYNPLLLKFTPPSYFLIYHGGPSHNYSVTSRIVSNPSEFYYHPPIQGFASSYDAFVSSNFPLVVNSFSSNNFTSIKFPYYIPSGFDIYFQEFDVGVGDTLPTYQSLFEGSYTPSVFYTEIDLNNYAYVALSLKNYNTEPFDTTFMVKGQLCLTPVYDYGMKQKTEYYSGYQIDRCSPVYDTFTPNRVSILKQDIENNSIYYLKAFDTSFDNIIKVDRNVFDITYISQENANNPNVVINGRSYPTIPYDNLTSSATISEEEGYISGESKNVFDISSDSSFITNLFSNPLQTLGNVWTSIITMFALVGSFISLLPITLQAFLYTAFSLAFVLGIIKILL